MTEDIETRHHELLFGVRRSVRYHNRRRAFFDRLHNVTTGLAVLLSSATFVSLVGQWPRLALVFSVSVLALSSFDLVIGYAEKARKHWELARSFIALEREMVLCASPDDGDIRRFTARRLEIESDEPPVLRVLDTLCHNELMRAMGYDRKEFKTVNWAQALFADFLDIYEKEIV